MTDQSYHCLLNGGDYDTREIITLQLLEQIQMPDVDTGATFADGLQIIGPRLRYKLARDNHDQPVQDIRGRYVYRWQYRLDEPNQPPASRATEPRTAKRPAHPQSPGRHAAPPLLKAHASVWDDRDESSGGSMPTRRSLRLRTRHPQ